MNTIDQIAGAVREGSSALLLSGRSLYDFVFDGDRIRPLFQVLRRTLEQEFGMVFVTYSRATGIQSFENSITHKPDLETIRRALQTAGLVNIPQDENEIVTVIRAAGKLLRSGGEQPVWQDGRPLRFALCFEFAEHIVPGQAHSSQTDGEKVVSELVYILSQSLVLRDSGSILIFHGRHDMVDALASGALRPIHLAQPTETDKTSFLSAALDLYDEAELEEGLTNAGVVSLSVNTPNRSIEAILRGSHYSHRPVTANEIAEQKYRDVLQLSEGTLVPLDTNRIRNVRLVGRNIEVPMAVLSRFADLLGAGNTSMAANVLMAGAPATAKTDLALLVAGRAQCPAYQMLSPKGGIVGETERKARLQQQALREWVPNVAYCDEITEAFPLERGEFNGDSGASRAVTAELLSSLSDETRRGKALLIASTNRIWAIGAAMRSRFVVIPVLSPLKEDIPAIIVSTAERVSPGSDVSLVDPLLLEAAAVFYAKGANPRYIRSALSNALLALGLDVLDAKAVRFAAADLCVLSDIESSIYADLQAIRFCTSSSFLPWSGRPDKYPFPEYLKGLVDGSSGEIDRRALDRRIEELKPYANV